MRSKLEQEMLMRVYQECIIHAGSTSFLVSLSTNISSSIFFICVAQV